MLSEVKNKYAIIGGALGLVAGVSFGAWLASGVAGGIGQNVTALLFLGLFGLGVGGGSGWFIGTIIQSPVVGLRLLSVIGAAVLFIALRVGLRLLGNPPWWGTLAAIGVAAGILIWWTNPRTGA